MTLFPSKFPRSQVLGQHEFCGVQGELFNLVHLVTLQPTFLNTPVPRHSLCVWVYVSSTAPPRTQRFSYTDVFSVLWSSGAYCVIGPIPCSVSQTFPSTLCLKHTQLLILICPVVFFSCLLVASYIFLLCFPLLNYICSHVCVSI